jgi:DNA-binding transcriptional ArsR family regulator
MVDAQLEALGVETRRHIYRMLLEGPRSVQDLADELPVSRPAVSQHLKVLVGAGLARSSTQGTRHIYSVDPAGMSRLRSWTESMWADAIDRFEELAMDKEREMLAEEVRVEPIVKTRHLSLDPEAAFELFTEKIAEWWPLATHSVGGEKAVSVRIEARVGGSIIETTDDGDEHEWGQVTSWEQGKRLEFTWHPGMTADRATQVEVRFREVGAGSEMLLIHTGWELRGEDAGEVRATYVTGWDLVLAGYEKAVEPA